MSQIWRRIQESNLLTLASNGFQDHRLTVRPILQILRTQAEETGFEPAASCDAAV